MNYFALKTKIPCGNCANSIKTILIAIPGVESVDCSIEESKINVKCREEAHLEFVKKVCIEELTKSGREIQ